LFCHARNHPEQIFHTCAALRSNQVGSRLDGDLLLLFFMMLAHFLISTADKTNSWPAYPQKARMHFWVSLLHTISDSADSLFFVQM